MAGFQPTLARIMLRPQKLAKGPLKAFKGKGGKCEIWVGDRLVICIGYVLTTETVQRPLY
ncbi:hypothetical protein HMPREF0880_00874 [Yokenella regensburgei ATCC 43003]|nr:hypothetical protein HMPREF0880_00874 [Yokenella regensburgei ATCC 43003]